jgi:hypothetical protein
VAAGIAPVGNAGALSDFFCLGFFASLFPFWLFDMMVAPVELLRRLGLQRSLDAAARPNMVRPPAQPICALAHGPALGSLVYRQGSSPSFELI